MGSCCCNNELYPEPTEAESKQEAMHTVLVTGANAGLGFEACRQLAGVFNVSKVYLGCRNERKATAAIDALVNETGKPRSTFEFVKIDTSDLDTCRAAADAIQPLTGIILNAGGMGGPNPGEKTSDGVTTQFAVNVLGHVVLIETLIAQGKLEQGARVVYSGSEGARGVPSMGMAEPIFDDSNFVEDMTKHIDGSFLNPFDGMEAYPFVKAIATFYISYMAEQNPEYCFLTISPGGTSGTNVMEDAPWYMRAMMATVGGAMMHSVSTGSLRYLAGLGVTGAHDIKESDSGVFFASIAGLTGPMMDQGEEHPIFRDKNAHAAAYEAIHAFIQ